ncbi:hypothetical protein PEDI_24210 [Persicobacter diffluens]|uniref:Uncharacterized protein n=1 Tax=Persicobacter diffluens TaxID=981 RepID=A0AAN5AKB7_9BACT|nr:hypothetical protein PEDI_24210 [Persicobacter diffluens]
MYTAVVLKRLLLLANEIVLLIYNFLEQGVKVSFRYYCSHDPCVFDYEK